MLDVEIAPEIAEIDMTGNVLQIGGGAEVGSGIFETGETILMMGHEGAARILLTHGPVVEVMEVMETQQISLTMSNRTK